MSTRVRTTTTSKKAVPPAPRTAQPANNAEKENPKSAQWDTLTDKQRDVVVAKLEQKYDIDGCNTLDIVFARQENDLIRQQLGEQQEQLAALMRENAALKSRTNVPAAADVGAESDQNTEVADALAQERAKNAVLQKQLEELSNAIPSDRPSDKIARPAGTAGNDFNIQNEMGLGGSQANREIYKALLRNLRDLALQAGIQWESTWAEIPASVKAKLFDVARARHPILADYVNDWATAEIVKQFIKNKRKNGYKSGWLEVPTKFAYLKGNSAKRDPSASRKRRTVAPKKAGAKKAATKAAKKAQVASTSSKKATATGKAKAKATAPSKPKRKVVVESDEDEDMEDDVAEESEEGSEA